MMKRLFILALVLFSGAASARPCCEHWGWTGKGAFLKAGAEEVAAVTRSATQLVASVQQQLTTLQSGFAGQISQIGVQTSQQKALAQGSIVANNAMQMTALSATASDDHQPTPLQDQTVTSALLMGEMKPILKEKIIKNNKNWLSDFYQVTPVGNSAILDRHEPYCSTEQAASGACKKAASALLQNADVSINTLLEPGGGQDETMSDEEVAASLAFIKNVVHPIPEIPNKALKQANYQLSDQAILALSANSFHAILAHRTRRHLND